MKWEGNRQSDNVEDRRGSGGSFGVGGRGIGVGSVVIALVAGGVFGINPLTTLGLLATDKRRRRIRRLQGSRPPMTEMPPLYLPCWLQPKMPGSRCSLRQGRGTSRRVWCCTGALRLRLAARGRRRWGRFIALVTARCIWTWIFLTP